MTKENTKLGSEYGIEVKIPYLGWTSVNQPGEGFESYEEAYQRALKIRKEVKEIEHRNREYRVVVYDYNRLGRKNIRVLTVVGD